MEKEREDALEMGKEKKKEDKESAEDESRKALMLLPVVGLDLAGSAKRPTGFCAMSLDLFCKTSILYSDEEIISKVLSVKPALVSIDAPLSLPKGRKSIDDASGPHFRQCDLELRKMHIKFFPITLGPMRMLTERGIRLKRVFEKRGIKVIESFPGGAQDILGIPRKQKGLGKLRKSLEEYGVKGMRNDSTGDELDAITCALVGVLFVSGNCLVLGDHSEGTLVLPKPAKH